MVSYTQASYNYGVNGVIIPDTADIQTDVQNEWKEVFGNDLSVEESTPQGRAIDIETTARINTLGFNATMANVLINISQAAGIVLDAWGANFGIYRNSATASQVLASITGVASTVIPEGSQAQDVNGILWQAESDIIIGLNGTATGTFICSQTGAIQLGLGELTTIVASGTLGIDGWETITNNVAATVGTLQESDNSFKARILESIFGGSALFGNYKSAVMKVNNVTAAYTYDNPYGNSLILDDITIPAHSVYVCVQGGNATDVAYALYEVKSAGAGWCGNTSVTITDKTYNTNSTVSYQVANALNFVVTVNVTSDLNSSSTLAADIKNVILDYFNGNIEGYEQPLIRGTVDPFVITTAIKSQISNITITDLKVGLETAANHAVAGIIKASAVNGLTWASVTTATFATAVSSTNGTYIFITYDGTNWKLNNNTVTLSDYGITATGTPVENDKIYVVFSTGDLSTSPIQIYASEIPSMSATNITVNINE